ncbi:hypothetical protein [Peterkaempfera bronchialis]|uniref:hypothetical protein n=1 Tax=Peterkaempfera bronchialis TaxID=2126346 RepID=UPI003C304E8F
MSEASFPAYVVTTDYRWTDRAYDLLEAQELTVKPHNEDTAPCFVVSGRCPRCDHHLVDRQVTVALTGMAGASRGSNGDPQEAVVLDVTCGCGTAHQDAPTGVTGCGVSFRIELTAE